MNCRICDIEFKPEDCGGLDSDLCRECFITNLSDDKCAAPKQKLCARWDCRSCFMKSFASTEKCKYWDYEHNSVWPTDVTRASPKLYWFNCTCGHTIELALNGVSCHGRWCKYCASRALCDDDYCITCFEKSFASHEKAKYWSAENTKVPRQVTKSSGTKYHFNCECGHTFLKPLNDVNKGSWCTYCANQKLCSSNDCVSCFEKSFASHESVKFWDDDTDPRTVFRYTTDKYQFKCADGHVFSTNVRSVTKGLICPKCHHKTERMVNDWLTENYPQSKSQVKFDWCVRRNKLSFDFQVDDYIIEVDGGQHFVDVKCWGTKADDVRSKDIYKMQAVLKNGLRMIRISQIYIYENRGDWKSDLAKALNCDKKCQYISHDEHMYDAHKSDIAEDEE